MLNYFRLALILLLSVASALHASMVRADDPPPFVEILADRDTLAALRAGGYVLYMRHGFTDNSKPDRVPSVDLDDCATQRPLTEEGRSLAASVGRSIRAAAIPVDAVFSSPLCRAKESAEAAFGPGFTVVDGLMYTANLTTAQKKPILETTRELLSRPVAPGQNRVIVAHAPNMADLIGFFVKPECTVVVIRPHGEGRFDYVASIRPDMWPMLFE